MPTYFDRPQRRSPRLKGYDYAQSGAYFVTICTHQRACLFGEVMNGEMRLNAFGVSAERCWQGIPVHFHRVELDGFVIMPNYVYGIVVIADGDDRTKHDDRTKYDSVRTRHAVSLPKPYTPEAFSQPVAGLLSTVMRSYKAAVTRAVNDARQTPGAVIWQGRFHDHIIRNERSLNYLRQYVMYNPARWKNDQFYLMDSL